MSEVITTEMQNIKNMIANTVAKRESLKAKMNDWYLRFPSKRFGKLNDLIVTDSVLSELDSNYKRLWDFSNTSTKSA